MELECISMKALCFYLFYDDKFHEIIGVFNEKISKTHLPDSTPNIVSKEPLSALSQTAACDSSDIDRTNFSITDNCKVHSQCGDCRCSDDGRTRKLTKRDRTNTKVFRSTNMIPMDRYQLSYFVYLLEQSLCYRQSVIRNFASYVDLKESVSLVKFRIKLSISMPSYHVLDFMWCRRLERLCYERQELETAMAWLSTLGGAFSALGDKAEHCAVIAGRISVQQLKNALRLGDPFTVARCKLYFSLSLIQQRKYKLAKQIIKEQYHIAVANAEKDFKLVRMCLGIWSKLKYEKKYKNKSKVS